MKKIYYTPEVEVDLVRLERNILSDYTTSSADMTVDEDTYSGITWTY